MYAHDTSLWLASRVITLDDIAVPHSQASSNQHCCCLTGVFRVIGCSVICVLVGGCPWLALVCFPNVFKLLCPWWLFACIGKGDVAKLNFTLAALEAKDPFANKVCLAFLVVPLHERICRIGCSV